MPIYSYKCKKCNTEIQVRVKLSDPPPANCDSLNKNGCDGSVEKQVSSTSFELKGGAWFKNGY